MDLSSSSAALRSLQRKAKNGSLPEGSLDLLSTGTQPSNYPLDTILKMLLDEGVAWEMVAFGVLLLKELRGGSLLAEVLVGQDSTGGGMLLLRLLEHREARVRMLCVSALSSICTNMSLPDRPIDTQLEFYNKLGPALLQQIRDKFVRAYQSQAATTGSEATIPMDDTTGWSSLESSMLAYYEIVKGGGSTLLLHVLQDASVAELLVSNAGHHQNRFVREATINFIADCCRLIANAPVESGAEESVFANLTSQYQGDEIPTHVRGRMTKRWGLSRRMADVLQAGLQDNWSRLRQAACSATLSFISGLQEEEDRLAFLPLLLPRICLNRFYAAEGVKTAAHDAWRALVGTKGRDFVERYVEQYIRHYTEMSKANNHMISEAACSAIAEILSRIDKAVVLPCLPLITQALTACLRDESWPVRDASCVATGSLLRYYGGDEELCTLFLDVCSSHLKDAIWSLRENAAVAICSGALQSDIPALKARMRQFALAYLTDNLASAQLRTAASGKVIRFLSETQMAALEANAVQVAARLQGDVGSTSSLTSAPKEGNAVWRQGGGWGCCLDCMVTRQGDANDITSGAVYILRELAESLPQEAVTYFDTVLLLLGRDAAAQPDAKKEKLQVSILTELPEMLNRLRCVDDGVDSKAKQAVQTLLSATSNRALVATAEDFLRRDQV